MSVALNWQSVRPAVPIGKVSGYFDLPAFSFDSQWLGASVIVAQYNLSLDRNFVLRNRPAKPANANCLLAIRYRVGSTVYRYKLWEDADCTLIADLYTGQVIKKNCVLEIWNLSTSTNSSQATVMRLYTSLMQVVTDFSTAPVDYADATAALQQDQFESDAYPLYTTGLAARYDAAIGVTTPTTFTLHQWLDSISGGLPLVATGAADCGYIPAGDVSSRFINFKPFVSFGSVGIFLSGAFPLASNNGLGTIYMVQNTSEWVLTNNLLSTSKLGVHKISVSDRGVSPQIKVAAGNPANFSAPVSDLPIAQNNGWHIMKVTLINQLGTGLASIQIDDLVEQGIGDNVGDSFGADQWILGPIGSTPEVLLYNTNISNGSAADIAIKNYLAAKFSLAYPLPLLFSDNNPFLDNN